jgi:low temperature requirement protein LtrA
VSRQASPEKNRVATPLELLFDLTFVAAIAQVAAQLAHGIADGHALESLGPYLMVFFAIWWAWMNFTWFASSYNTDDVLYRALVLVQMAGVLIIAAGVPSTFSSQNLTAVIIGYAVMRVGLVALWIRAGVERPAERATAFRFGVGIAGVQLLWLARLLLPDQGPWWLFIVLAAMDLAVPMWAERTGSTNWHPHHIAERHGLFTIIVLGESVYAATVGVQNSVGIAGLSGELVIISIAGLVLLFALWWLYFLHPAGEGLAARRRLSYVWGYGHFGIFASLAALGAGLEVAVEGARHPLAASPELISFVIALPVAIFVVVLSALHTPLGGAAVMRPAATGVAASVLLLIPFAAGSIGTAGCLVAIALSAVGLLAMALTRDGTLV